MRFIASVSNDISFHEVIRQLKTKGCTIISTHRLGNVIIGNTNSIKFSSLQIEGVTFERERSVKKS